MTITFLFVIFQPNANSSAALLHKTFTLFLGKIGDTSMKSEDR